VIDYSVTTSMLREALTTAEVDGARLSTLIDRLVSCLVEAKVAESRDHGYTARWSRGVADGLAEAIALITGESMSTVLNAALKRIAL
jgi:hypothetical protein